MSGRDEQSHRKEAAMNEASQIYITDPPKTSVVEAVEITADLNFGEPHVESRVDSGVFF